MVTRIAILGGGPAALAAAFELTNSPDWRDRYAIDLYQIGWRLGGKCASSRNRALHGHNEEHGLHVLGGFYHNTFQQLEALYEAWPDCSPHAIPADEAFVNHSAFTLMQRTTSGWRPVRVQGPADSRKPGVGAEPVTPLYMLGQLLRWLSDALRGWAQGAPSAAPLAPPAEKAVLTPEAAAQLLQIADQMSALEASFNEGPFAAPLEAVAQVATAAQSLIGGVPSGVSGADWFGMVELALTIARGMAADRLPMRGYDAINHLEAAEWLRLHGASPRALACPLFEAGYHYAFAYEDGDIARPNMAAGAGTRGLLRMVFASHGSIFVHMNGGMGEVFVTPYYEVLRARGVNFHFFHRVESLEPGADGRLDVVKIKVQAHTIGGKAYEPLFDHVEPGGGKIRRCWPSVPDNDQLEPKPQPAGAGDLGSWEGSRDLGEDKTLLAGRDFDICVLGLSIGVLREVAEPLAKSEPRWRHMLDAAMTAPTIAAQLWRKDKPNTFGGYSRDGLMTGYEGPFDTWSDMSFLTPWESPVGGTPAASLSYLCGPWPQAQGIGDPDAVLNNWLNKFGVKAFPGWRNAAGGYDRDEELARYARTNIDPIDLFVITPAGSVDVRLRPDGSGFTNLFLAGDWTRSNFDVGCVEAAVLSGRLCAKAISGEPRVIYGESDLA